VAAIDIEYDVSPVAQTKVMSCWAAAAAMLLSWKTGIPLTELQAAQEAGPNFEIELNSDAGLSGPEVGSFAAALGLVAEAPQNWDPDGYASLLTSHGPLWVGAAISDAGSLYRHVRILAGITGDGTFDGTIAWIVDPSGGTKYQESLTAFATELETIARQDLPDGSDLNPQVIHFP
jgi:Papain-like cysteine protease AvrRpt2